MSEAYKNINEVDAIRESNITKLNEEIYQYLMQDRTKPEKKALIRSIKFLQKYFEYIVEDKEIELELSSSKPHKAGRRSLMNKQEKVRHKLNIFNEDIVAIQRENKLFRNSYNFLYTKFVNLSRLHNNVPQLIKIAFGEKKVLNKLSVIQSNFKE